MKIVVGICTRNNEDTIQETLTSIMEQERKPDRIIVCDSSDDKTLDIVRNLSQDREIPIDIIYQKGDGVGDAYQQIYMNLRQDIDVLATIQTNLVVSRYWLLRIEQGFEENPWADLVVPSFIVRDEGKPSTNSKLYSERTGGKIGYFSGRNMAIKVKALKTIGGWDRNFLRGEDWDLHIRLWKAGIRSVAVKGLQHRWIKYESMVTLKKSIRNPTSLTFLAKFGFWYLRFRPIHFFGDLCSISLLTLLILIPVTGAIALICHNLLPFILNLVFAVSLVGLYQVVYLKFYQRLARSSNFYELLKHETFTAIGFFSALHRLIIRTQKWNMIGFRQKRQGV